MAKGLIVKCEDLAKVNVVVKLFNGQRWEIKGNVAERFAIMHKDGKQTRIYFKKKSLREIFPEIHILFDTKNRVIGQRTQPKCRLLTTRANKYFGFTSPNTKTTKNQVSRALEVYALIANIDQKEYEEMIQTYWYQEKQRNQEKAAVSH